MPILASAIAGFMALSASLAAVSAKTYAIAAIAAGTIIVIGITVGVTVGETNVASAGDKSSDEQMLENLHQLMERANAAQYATVVSRSERFQAQKEEEQSRHVVDNAIIGSKAQQENLNMTRWQMLDVEEQLKLAKEYRTVWKLNKPPPNIYYFSAILVLVLTTLV